MSTLTSPTSTSVSTTSVQGSVVSDTGSDNLYALVSTNATETASTVMTNGSSIIRPIATVGKHYFLKTGLTQGTQYYFHFVHGVAPTANSAVVSSSVFTTLASPPVEIVQSVVDMQTRQRINSGDGVTPLIVKLGASSDGFISGSYVEYIRIGTIPVTFVGINGATIYAPGGVTLRNAGDVVRATFDGNSNTWDLDYYALSGV